MITILNDAPENVAAFNATGEFNYDDIDNLIIPHIQDKVSKFSELNYLLYLDTDHGNTEIPTILENTMIKINSVSICNRTAIVSDHQGIEKFTNAFNAFNTGKNLKSFAKDDVYSALYWCNNGKRNRVLIMIVKSNRIWLLFLLLFRIRNFPYYSADVICYLVLTHRRLEEQFPVDHTHLISNKSGQE
ncbi:STAS/SEC14 domain-containing protein [Chryseobacterium indoltheticum]|uniref:STAS/SEC14 domain-containing protein n=1 Tax=Chryseobacterium indoltheticum TaxID=254 RepID=UPI003F496FC3